MRSALILVAGVLIISFAFTEIFLDLFHPTRTGSLSDWIGRTLFRLFRSWPRALSSAGPLTVVLVVLCWSFLQAIGFAFIYSAGYPEGFRLLNRANEGVHATFPTMFYFSLQVMTTLGLGDVMPKADWLRIVVSLQALIGLAILTASVSSIVLVYPALGRMRLLARRVTILNRAAKEAGLGEAMYSSDALLRDFATAVIQTRVDFIHFPVIYYFHSDHRRSSLASALPRLVLYADRGADLGTPESIRLAAAMLRHALNDLAAILDERFLHTGSSDPAVVFRAYGQAHLIREMQPD
ncbi:MAG: hypothetical protein JO340_01790 [Acidobacteriaceae bacterium]|nr:hypothetical protein [Acidobacteriaceae bacterium]